jgi:leucyl aminopeptidase
VVSYLVVNEHPGAAIPLVPLRKSGLEAWQAKATTRQQRWLRASGFEARPGQCLALPDDDGSVQACIFGMQEEGWLYQLAAIYRSLPQGCYVLTADWTDSQVFQATLGWGLAAYRYERYKKNGQNSRVLQITADVAGRVQPLCAAQCLVRDLVNTPTEHLGPAQLADAVMAAAEPLRAHCRVISGEELLTSNFPAIHAVGRASSSAPRLIELSWGAEDAPLLALVGKGVCFDSGGLDLKNASGMALMKKDMGGAAHALALARLVMEHQLPVRLLLLIPAVENAVSGNAYRPGDVIATRKGLSVEIGNTDAEGRVVLADALAYACEHQPELVIDFATLTGAARIALGPDLPALFSNQPEVARDILQAGVDFEDPLWAMPLYQPYVEQIKSPIADLSNSSKNSYGGCITAALFLEHFVTKGTPWVHIDTFAWNQASRAGRPEGGEALGLRAVFHYLKSRYA